MRPGAAFERRMKIAEPRLETILIPFVIPRLFPLMLVHHVAGMTLDGVERLHVLKMH